LCEGKVAKKEKKRNANIFNANVVEEIKEESDTNKNLDESDKIKIKAVLEKYYSAFGFDKKRMGRTNRLKFKIQT